ncbi:MAG TPA: O-antigen ligase family protein [Candidatus Acidoferrum sp.]|nr:O-antigen ligase family protein [Candidatus Acidoferrum sp.]
MKSETPPTRIGLYALAFGLFLGLAILKFGNPVILDYKITPPATPGEYWVDAWPTRWANWILWPLALAGAGIFFARPLRWPGVSWLWLLPCLWFGWQLLSATQTVDGNLTAITLCQFAGCLCCYFIGALNLGRGRNLRWLLVALLLAFAFCLVRGINQRLFEFPQSRQMLVEGERAGWTNIPPELMVEMKRDQAIITTNGVDVANPVMLAKFANGRVMGTLVYPNALAGVILLLLPVSLVLAFTSASRLRPPLPAAVTGLTVFLGGLAFFWTGSKLGWLIAMAMAVTCLLRLPWPVPVKGAALAGVAVIGFGIFAVRFHSYFAGGATSAGARLDYWRAAVTTVWEKPLLGTGPGTFQRPYARLKVPEAEMARLTHNDYLEQFSDSGVVGGMLYAAWITLGLVTVGRRVWHSADPIAFAIFLGVLGWFIQGLGEFSLYVPALAWTAFTLLGFLLAATANEIDKPSGADYATRRP